MLQLEGDTLRELAPEEHHINVLEGCAGPVSLDTWPELVEDAESVHFVDNDAAAAALVAGYSASAPQAEIVGGYHQRAAKGRSLIFIDRVESKSNLADGPTRGDVSLVVALGAVKADPVLTAMRGVAGHPLRWWSDATIPARFAAGAELALQLKGPRRPPARILGRRGAAAREEPHPRRGAKRRRQRA